MFQQSNIVKQNSVHDLWLSVTARYSWYSFTGSGPP